jgi:hypothetical protein
MPAPQNLPLLTRTGRLKGDGKVGDGRRWDLFPKVSLAPDLYGACMGLFLSRGFSPRGGAVDPLIVLWVADSSWFGAGKAVLHPVACDQVPGARGRGQGTETLAQLGGLPP